MTEIDVRGLDCAERASRVRQIAQDAGIDAFSVLVDDETKADGIARSASQWGWQAVREPLADHVRLLLKRDTQAAGQPNLASQGEKPTAKVVGFITSNLLGVGDEALGRVLMRLFIKSLQEIAPLPTLLIFANSGVRLTTAGSDLIADLRELERRGVGILSCGTCLDYYHLKEALEVGTVTNMYEMVTHLVEADRVLRP
jgi:selenium metabolism protein YedF